MTASSQLRVTSPHNNIQHVCCLFICLFVCVMLNSQLCWSHIATTCISWCITWISWHTCANFSRLYSTPMSWHHNDVTLCHHMPWCHNAMISRDIYQRLLTQTLASVVLHTINAGQGYQT